MNKTSLCMAIAAGLVLCWSATTPGAETADSIVAVVDGEPIMRSDIDRAVGRPRQLTNEQIRQILERLIAERLLSQAARKEGISESITNDDIESELEVMAQRAGVSVERWNEMLREVGFTAASYRELVRDQLAQREYVNRKIGAQVAVAPEDIIRFYKDNQGEFSKPERRKVRMVSIFANNFNLETPAERREAARKQAGLVADMLAKNSDMAALARQYSKDKYASDGGEVGWISRESGLAPLFAEKAFTMEVGQVSDIITTPESFHIIKSCLAV